MSRDVGQVTVREALLGGLGIALLVAMIVAGAHALLSRPPPLPTGNGATVAEPSRPCPHPRETAPHATAAPPAAARPIAVTSGELIACPTRFDRQPVVFEGEVVRGVLRRGDRAWVQLNDDPYGIGPGPLPVHRTTLGANSGVAVSIPAADADRVTVVGDGSAHGDRLRVEGTFLRADPDDAGAPSIQASAVEIIAVGEPLRAPVSPPRIAVALLLCGAAAAVTRQAVRSRAR